MAVLVGAFALVVACTVLAAVLRYFEAQDGQPRAPFWAWPLLLFALTLAVGVLAVPAGVGGGVLFVPLVAGLFPFHMDFVRCAGLLVALSGSLAAGPRLLRRGFASLRLALPIALVTSTCSIAGAVVGLSIPQQVVRMLLGLAILGVAGLMLKGKREYPDVPRADALSRRLGIRGVYLEPSENRQVDWKAHRTGLGLLPFAVVGFLAGMFGLGAGWANTPVLNLVMGMPIRVAAGSSKFLLAITDSTAAWVYVHSGAVIAMIVVPSIVGIMLGSWLGVAVFGRLRPVIVKWFVLAVMVFAALQSLLRGFGIV